MRASLDVLDPQGKIIRLYKMLAQTLCFCRLEQAWEEAWLVTQQAGHTVTSRRWGWSQARGLFFFSSSTSGWCEFFRKNSYWFCNLKQTKIPFLTIKSFKSWYTVGRPHAQSPVDFAQPLKLQRGFPFGHSREHPRLEGGCGTCAACHQICGCAAGVSVHH